MDGGDGSISFSVAYYEKRAEISDSESEGQYSDEEINLLETQGFDHELYPSKEDNLSVKETKAEVILNPDIGFSYDTLDLLLFSRLILYFKMKRLAWNVYGNINQQPEEKWASQRTKILILVSFAGLAGPATSSIYYPCLSAVAVTFNQPDPSIWLSLSVAMYTLMVGILPIFWGPLSDKYSRKWILVGCLGLYGVFSYVSALSTDIYMLTVFRALTGIPVAAIFVVAIGIISDVFPPKARGGAMGKLSLLPLSAPIIAYPLGGALAEYHFELVFLVTAAIGIFTMLVLLYLLPETLDRSKNKHIKYNPISPFKNLLSVKIAPIAFASAMGMACLLLVNLVLPLQIGKLYPLSSFWIGIALLPMGIGNMIGALLGGRIADFCRKWGVGGRLVPTNVGLFFASLSVIAFGLTLNIAIWYPVTFAFIATLMRTATGPGAMTFCIEQNPKEASGISSCIASLQFIFAFVAQAIGPNLANLIGGYDWLFLGMGGITILALIPTCYFMVVTTELHKIPYLNRFFKAPPEKETPPGQ